MTRRSTKTVIVLSFLSLTTVPCSVRLGILLLSCRALARRSLPLALGRGLRLRRLALWRLALRRLALRRLGLARLGRSRGLALATGLLGQNGVDARDVAAHHAH